MYDQCPGIARLKTPTLEVRTCPQCGAEVEIFATDVSVPCDNCGFIVYNDRADCIQWCQYARKCIGDDLYDKLVTNRQKPEQ